MTNEDQGRAVLMQALADEPVAYNLICIALMVLAERGHGTIGEKLARNLAQRVDEATQSGVGHKVTDQ